MQRELLRGLLALILALGFTACSTDDEDCADSEKICADGSAPTDGLCDDETAAICPASGGAAAPSAGTSGMGGTSETPEMGGGTTGGMTGGAAAGGEKEKTFGTPDNPAELGEACVMANGDEGICVSDMTTTCQVALNGSPCKGVRNGCCPDGLSMPKTMSGGGDDEMMSSMPMGGGDDTDADTENGGSDDTDTNTDTNTENGGTDESETNESETDESETDESETDESETDESETDESESDDGTGGNEG
ncbi:MAG: hypothetical protein VX589_05120 [Myxococcota bacterium]|nr:hypothetical protein [Myxococcota bacterium]